MDEHLCPSRLLSSRRRSPRPDPFPAKIILRYTLRPWLQIGNNQTILLRANLIETTSGSEMWGEQYDVSTMAISDLRGAISEKVAAALKHAVLYVHPYQIIVEIAEEARHHPNLLCVVLFHTVMDGPQESGVSKLGDRD